MRDASPSTTIEDLISSATVSNSDDIITILAKRGCKDLTSSINFAACSQMPRAGGGYCDVYEGKLNDTTTIAIKSLRVYDGPNAETQRKKILKHAARELYHWAKLRHPNVLPLLGLSLFRGQISMISEWMTNGNLMTFLEANPDADRIGFCVDICTGLRYIHAHGMAHGDLKAANIMVSSYGVAMIADFGCARLKDLTLKFTNTTSNAFSVRWAAPELLDQSDGPEDNKAADVYASAMTVLVRAVPCTLGPIANALSKEVLSGEVPFTGVQDARVMFLVAVKHEHPPRPKDIDNDIWDILVSCWNPTPEDRPSIRGVSKRLRGLIGPIINETSIDQLLGHLERHGCSDITNPLDASEYPVSRGGPWNIHRGDLLDSDLASLKSLRPHMDLPGMAEGQLGAGPSGTSRPVEEKEVLISSQESSGRRRRKGVEAKDPGRAKSKGKTGEYVRVVPPVTVLVAEDNPINQIILATFIKRKKIECDVAQNGLQAVEKWKTGRFHIIFMDIQMPEMDGIEATREIRRLEKAQHDPSLISDSKQPFTPLSGSSPLRPSVVIIALTASSLQSDRVAALAAGCNDFLTKPVALDWLDKKIIDWGSIKALQMWSALEMARGQEAKSKGVATQLRIEQKREELSIPIPPEPEIHVQAPNLPLEDERVEQGSVNKVTGSPSPLVPGLGMGREVMSVMALDAPGGKDEEGAGGDGA